MTTLRFDRVGRRYHGRAALDAVDLTVPSGAVTVLSGPPRAGKSVLLRLLVGLERPDTGRILLDDDDIARMPPARRPIGYVPQSFALFPHMSVRDNIAFPLREAGADRALIERRLAPVAATLRIEALLERRPAELSGGQKQRVAIARGVLGEHPVLALDDPLVGLDFKLRESLMDDLRDMQRALGATVIYATGDPLEALAMADHLALFDGGRLVEAGPVETLYRHPERLRTAELTGFPRCNVLRGTADDTGCALPLGRVELDAAVRAPRMVAAALRPEHVRRGRAKSDRPSTLAGTARVRLLEHLGADCVVHLELESGDTLVAIPSADDAADLAIGAAFEWSVDPASLALFDGETGQRLVAAPRTQVHAHA